VHIKIFVHVFPLHVSTVDNYLYKYRLSIPHKYTYLIFIKKKKPTHIFINTLFHRDKKTKYKTVINSTLLE